jgi:hypothetical protein
MKYKMMRHSPQFVVTQKMSTDNELVGLAAAPVTSLLMKIGNLRLQARRKSKNALLISSNRIFTVYKIFKSY